MTLRFSRWFAIFGLIAACAGCVSVETKLATKNIGSSGSLTNVISPQDSATMDVKHDLTTHDFHADTKRRFPILFLVGDSTVHNSQQTIRGWGDVIGKYFSTNKIRVENHALGGRSSRTFITQGWWDKI